MASRNPNSISEEGLKTTLVGIVVSACLALVKGISGVLGHSYALVADAIESATDVVSSTLLWFGLKWATKPPDSKHPYGHGKAEALVAVGISLALLAAAGVIVRDSIEHILHPHKTPAPFTLIVLVAVVVTKELLYRFVVKTGKEINSEAVKADAFHHRSDAITSIAAFIGISIALWGGEGFEVADDYAALLAAALIVYNAYKILRPALGELLDEDLPRAFKERIMSIVELHDQVLKVEQCRGRKMGPAYHLDLHLWLDGELTVDQGHQIAHDVKDSLFAGMPEIIDVHIHIEPAEKSTVSAP